MDRFIYNFNKLLPYFFIFPIFIILVILILNIISKKKVTENNIYIFGIFINLNNKDILLICLLLIQFYFIVSSLFVNNSSYYVILFLLLPTIAFTLLVKKYYRLIANIILTIFIYTLIIFKDVFYSYINEVTPIWYVNLIYIVLCLSILAFSIFNFVFNFSVIIKNKKLKDLK